MTRPDFLVIGAMKCGTTSLYRYLRAHPQIQMAEPKELHFFSEPEVWARGWDWYEQRFPVREAATVAVGEASTSYTKYPQYPNVAELRSQLAGMGHAISGLRNDVAKSLADAKAIEDRIFALNQPIKRGYLVQRRGDVPTERAAR